MNREEFENSVDELLERLSVDGLTADEWQELGAKDRGGSSGPAQLPRGRAMAAKHRLAPRRRIDARKRHAASVGRDRNGRSGRRFINAERGTGGI